MRSQGFTLVELLVVIAILGILSAIALPMFRSHRERAWDARVQDLAQAFYKAQEAYYVDHNTYHSCTITAGVSGCGALPGVAGLDYEGFSGMTMNLPGGMLLVVCHQNAPHAFAFVTDPTHMHYNQGNLDEVNMGGSGVGQCLSFILSLGP